MSLNNREDFDLDLEKYLLVLKRRWPLGSLVFGATICLFLGVALLAKTSYTAEGKILFKRVDETIPWIGLGNQTGQLRSLLDHQTPLTTQIEIMTSHNLLQEVINRVGLRGEQGNPLKVEDFKRKLNIGIVGATDIIRVAYKDSDAQTAANVVNTLMQTYIEDNMSKQRSDVVLAREFLAKQLPEVEADFVQAESALRQFKEANQVVDLPQEAESTVQAMENLNLQIAATMAELDGLNAQISEFQENLRLDLDKAIGINILSQSPKVQGALSELAIVEQELSNASKNLQPTHPVVIALQEKKTLLLQAIDDEVEQVLGSGANIPKGLLHFSENRESLLESYIALETQRLNLSQQLQSLSKSRSEYISRASLFPKLEETQQQLERRVEVARVTYEALLQRFQEVQIAENKTPSNAEIAMSAIAPEEGSTGRTKLLAVGLLAGLFFATLAILIQEMRDKSLKTLREIRALFQYPILGVIPLLEESSAPFDSEMGFIHLGVTVRDQPDSFVSEIYRMIQANLKFLNSPGKKVKVIVVTSSVPREGKSTVAANLAAAIGQLGRHVLLIDADLRNPVQHHLWVLSNEIGLSHVLSAQSGFAPKSPWGTEHLEVLTAGVTPPNPLKLLDSPQMSSLIQKAADEFDFVIIDAPPIALMADALTLGQFSDGILLVTRPGLVDRDSAIRVQEMLEKSDQNVLGLIVNGLAQNDIADSFNYSRWQIIEPSLDAVAVSGHSTLVVNTQSSNR